MFLFFRRPKLSSESRLCPAVRNKIVVRVREIKHADFSGAFNIKGVFDGMERFPNGSSRSKTPLEFPKFGKVGVGRPFGRRTVYAGALESFWTGTHSIEISSSLATPLARPHTAARRPLLANSVMNFFCRLFQINSGRILRRRRPRIPPTAPWQAHVGRVFFFRSFVH